jgi:nitric oxide reductase subunit B
LAISIPGINFFTHGTHITVAHAMGSTIGINTTILLASLFFINQETLNTKLLTKLFWIFHFSLLVFWLALIVAGAKKGLAQVFTNFTFQEIKFLIKPYFVLFALSGAGIVISLLGFISVLFDKLLIQYHKIK